MTTNLFTLLLLFSVNTFAQSKVSPDWFLINSSDGQQTYSWQKDSKYYDALAYDVSSVLFDLHNFDCFDTANPQNCLNQFQRCPVPRSTSGGPDNSGWDTFMDNFTQYGYCTSSEEMTGALSQYPTSVTGSTLFVNSFGAGRLSNREGFFLDSYAAVPKSIRRSATAIAKQMMSGVKFGLPSSLGPTIPANPIMTCTGGGGTENFKSFRNFAEYPAGTPGVTSPNTRRAIAGPVGFYDCAQRVPGSLFPGTGVDFTIRDRGNSASHRCVNRQEIYFEESDCAGAAYIHFGSTAPPDDFYRFRNHTSATESVVDLSQPPYSGSGVIGTALGSTGNPYGVPKSMFDVLTDFSSATGSLSNEKKSIVVGFFTEILDRTIYYAKPTEIFRRTVKFEHISGGTTLPGDYQNFINPFFIPVNATQTPNSKMNSSGTCSNLSAAAQLALENHYFGYLDHLDGGISDYSGYIMRPYRDIDPSATGTAKKALYVNTLPTNSFGPSSSYASSLTTMSDFVNALEISYPVARTPIVKEQSLTVTGIGPTPPITAGSFPGKECLANLTTPNSNELSLLLLSAPLGNLCRVRCPSPASGLVGHCNNSLLTSWSTTCKGPCYTAGKIFEPVSVTRREWWTEDGFADESGFLSVLSCSADEYMMALGKEDPITSFTTPLAYPGLSGAPPALATVPNAYCSSVDSSDPPKCVRPGGSGLKEDFNKYCVRYLIGKQIRRTAGGATVFGPFGNSLFEMSSLNMSVRGGAMVCEDDEIFVKPASGSAPAGAYSKAVHSDGIDYSSNIHSNAYFFKESTTSGAAPAIDVNLILEQNFITSDGKMPIPARAIGLGDPTTRLPMNHGICVRPRLELDHNSLQLGPLSVPLRNYMVDYMIRNSGGVSAGTPPHCP